MLVELLVEFIGWLGWVLIFVFVIVFSYWLMDLVWGLFVLFFYLWELYYLNDEVVIVFKFFGVGMMMVGIVVGVLLFMFFGWMFIVVLGVLFVVILNLFYVDLV